MVEIICGKQMLCTKGFTLGFTDPLHSLNTCAKAMPTDRITWSRTANVDFELYEFLNSASDGDYRPALSGGFTHGKGPNALRTAGRVSLLAPCEMRQFVAHLLYIRGPERGT